MHWVLQFIVTAAVVVLVARVHLAFQCMDAEIDRLRESVKDLARLTLSMDKRLWKLEGRVPHGDTTEQRFLGRLGLVAPTEAVADQDER